MVGGAVTAGQMKLLFGTGAHPVTGEQLGAAYKVYRNETVNAFNREVARRVAAVASTTSTGEARPPFDVLARVRSEVAAESFARDHGRAPGSAHELSDALGRYARPKQSAVAGYDLSFSPV